MKKYFAIFALVFASVISVYGQHKQAADSGAVIVDMNKQTIGMPTHGTGRSLDASVIIEACAYPSQGLVEVTLYFICYEKSFEIYLLVNCFSMGNVG